MEPIPAAWRDAMQGSLQDLPEPREHVPFDI